MKIHIVLAALLVLGCWLQDALAKPEFAADIGQTCEFCHLDPDGGGPRNQTGQLFEANGFEFPFEFDIDDPDSYFASHAAAGAMPEIRFALDVRTAYIRAHDVSSAEVALANCQSCHTSQDTFLLMKAEIKAIAQPHERLSIEVSNDAGEMLDAFAVIDAIPENLRVKVGQFALPFGLNQGDHNILPRTAYNLGSNRRDVGVEVNGTAGVGFYSVAVVNGRSGFARTTGTAADGNQHKSVAANLGVRTSTVQAGISGYVNRPGDFDQPDIREMRLAAYGSATYRDVTLQGEVNLGGEFGAGESFGFDLDSETGDINSWGYYLGASTRPTAKSRVGARYEFFDPNRAEEGDRQRRVVLTGSCRILPNATLDVWYWLNIAEDMRPDEIADVALMRQLQGSDQLIVMSRFSF